MAFPQIMNYQFNSKQRKIRESEIFLKQKNKKKNKLPFIKNQQHYQELFNSDSNQKDSKKSGRKIQRKRFENPYHKNQKINYRNQNQNPNEFNKRKKIN